MQDIKTVSIADENYPEMIKKLSDAPEVLYYRGTLPTKDELCVAIVGTRRPSGYGEQATFQLSRELADANVAIVSGLAPGIDTIAHTACVERGKRTIAVLGSGLDERAIYPQENVELARQIIAHGGCLISEYPPTKRGMLHQFPARNRLVVALSLGVVVVEAKEKSGSLITARLAQEQKKKLFAVPGPIYSLNSKGPNALIKAGTQLIENAQDVLDVLGIESSPGIQGKFSAATPEESAILAALAEGSLPVDALIEKTKLSAPVVAQSLALMEISGRIRNLGGNTYSLS